MTWQMIDTAPTDGTRFLAFSGWGYAILHWAPFSNMDDGSGAFWDEGGFEPFEGIDAPTHWMPLPAAPAEAER